MSANFQEDGIAFGDEAAGMSREMRRIAQWLKQVRFRRQPLGGVSERDVWRRIGELNDMYRAALTAERARYDALLERQCSADAAGEDDRGHAAGGARG